MKKTFLYTAAIIGLIGFAAPVNAQTVTTQTYVQTKDVPNTKAIPFSQFDANKDGVYSMEEVGEVLFHIFDTNGDKYIDNIEWDNKNVYTITPMKKETFKFIDHDSDGKTDEATYTYDTFYKASGLIKFDEDEDGLSAKEFIGMGFEELDSSENKMIDMEEWQKAYLETLPEHAKNKNYN